MSFRVKSALLVSLVTAGLIVTLYLLFSTQFQREFSQLEQREVEEETLRAVRVLQNELESLDAQGEDWAPWDDTYRFIEDVNEDYIRNNLSNEVFANLRLNLMLFVRASGPVVYAKAFDLESEQEIPVPAAIYDLAAEEFIVHHTDPRQGRTGIVLLPEYPLLFSSWPIVTSRYQGPIRGALVMGRYLTPSEVQRIADLSGTSLDVYPTNSLEEMPDDVRIASAAFLAGESIWIRPMSEETVAGYALLRDIHEKPALILRVRLPRTIYQEGQQTIRYHFFSLLTIGILFGIISMLLLEKFVVSRVMRMSVEVEAIGSDSDPSRRLQVKGKDELSRLGMAINRMLEAIQSAQQARAESDARYRMVVEQASEGIVLVNSSTGQIMEANTAFQAMVGYGEDELVQRTFYDLFKGAGEADEDMRQALEERFFGEWLCRRKDGSSILVEVAVNRISYRGQEALCFLVRDITERKRMEQYLIQTERMTAMGQLAATLIHEINNPLHSIWTTLELITEFPLDEAERKGHLQSIRREMQRLMRLTRQILAFARPPRQERAPVNIGETVRYALNLAERQLKEHAIRVSLIIPDDLPPVQGSHDQLAQVFLNVILNAVDSMPNGGHLDIRAVVERQQLVLTFTDTGPGIPPEVMAHLFEPFVTTKKEGTGLGLAISQNIIRHHGGTITATNAPQGGAIFTITLPI